MPIQPGMQRVAMRVATKIVGCREAGCEWFLHGKEGIDEGAPFKHPAGVECGDHARCTHPNCPCPQRLAWEIGADGRHTGRRGHKVQDVDRPLQFKHATRAGARPVTEDEFVTRLYEGVDTIQHIRTRGL